MAHLHSWQGGAGCWWVVLVPLHTGAYTGLCECCFHGTLTCFLQNEQSKRASQKWHLRPHLGSHTLWLFSVLFLQICCIQCGWGLHQGLSARSKDHWEPSWRLATIAPLFHISSPTHILFILLPKMSHIQSLPFISVACSLIQDIIHTQPFICSFSSAPLTLKCIFHMVPFIHFFNQFNIYLLCASMLSLF